MLGPIIGGLALGIAEAFGTDWFGSTYGNLISFTILVAGPHYQAKRDPRKGGLIMEKKKVLTILICCVVLLIAVLFPLFSNNFIIRFGTDILMFAIMASAWNIIGGYTGYASFGNVVFFGIGGYITAVLMEKAGLHFAFAYLAAGLGAALFAVLIGLARSASSRPLFCHRDPGRGRSNEGPGAKSSNNRREFGDLPSHARFLHPEHNIISFIYMMLGTLILTLGATYLMLRSKLGYSLIAIRENEEAANSVGINTTCPKPSPLP